MSEKDEINIEEKVMIRCPKCGEELFAPIPSKMQKELGFLLLGVVFGAVLGIFGNLWAAFLVEFLRNLIPQKSWTVASTLGLVITTISSISIIVLVIKAAVKYTTGEEKITQEKEMKEGVVP